MQVKVYILFFTFIIILLAAYSYLWTILKHGFIAYKNYIELFIGEVPLFLAKLFSKTDGYQPNYSLWDSNESVF
jgi:hypothetical protein